MTNHQNCQLFTSVLWNETAWAIALALSSIDEEIPKTGLSLSERDFTVELSKEYDYDHYSDNCYEESAQERLERLVTFA